MGYKRVIRSLIASSNRSQRASMRHLREIERDEKARARMAEAEQSQLEVKQFENHIERMITVHKECGDVFDWQRIIKRRPPQKPDNTCSHELEATKALQAYKPGLFAKISGFGKRKQSKLRQAVIKAAEKDIQDYAEDLKSYEEDLAEHISQVDLAKRILAGDLEAYLRAIQEIDPISELSELGTKADFIAIDTTTIKAVLHSHGQTIIPRQMKTVLASGKLSIKDMPVGRYNEIYQDYVCSASIRVARELFALLPVNTVLVNSVAKLLNPATGTLEDQIILSVKFVRSTMATINFDAIDPSDCMANFVHSMGFKRTQGMKAVPEVTA